MAIQLAVMSEWHFVIAGLLIFLLFGGKKLPELARGLGEAMKEFKKSQREITDDSPAPRSEARVNEERLEATKKDVTAASAGSSKPVDPKLN